MAVEEIVSFQTIDTTQAVAQITKLVKGLGKLSASLTNLSYVNRLVKLNEALRTIPTVSDTKIKNLTALGKSLERVNVGLSTISNVSKLTKLADSLNTLKAPSESNITRLASLGTSINKLNTAVVSLSPEKLTKMTSTFNALGVATSGLTVSTTNIGEFSKSISRLVLALDKIPQMASDLKKLDFDQLANDTARLNAILTPLATNFGNLATGVNKMIPTINKIPTAVNKADKSLSTLSKNPLMTIAKITGIGYSIRQLSNIIVNFISSAIDFIENVNLFGVAMGEDFVVQAEAFIDTLERAFSIDTSEVMRYMGIFNQLATSAGLAADQAYILSENFIKLGYDLASLFNITEEEAFSKLESGMAGLSRPLRDLGIDITENALSLTAAGLAAEKYALGEKALAEGNTEAANAYFKLSQELNSSIEGWTRAQKEQMIYLTILEQTTNAQGDFARTINSPANQLKTLGWNLEKLSRSIGNLFLYGLGDILPVLNAFVMLLTDVIETLGIFFGYSLPSAEDAASNAADTLGDLSDDVEGLSDAYADLNTQLIAGVDNFTTLSNSNSGGILGDGFSGLELEGYINGMEEIKSTAHEIYDVIKKFEAPLIAVTAALTAMVGATMISNVMTMTASLKAMGVGITGLNMSISNAGLVGIAVMLLYYISQLEDPMLRTVLAGTLIAAVALKIAFGIQGISSAVAFATLAIGKFTVAQKSLMASSAALLILLVGAYFIYQSWGDMSTAQRIVSVLGLVTAAALAAAVAFGIFHSTWSLGLAVTGIVAGIAAVIGAISAAKSSVGDADLGVDLTTSTSASSTSSMLSSSSLASNYTAASTTSSQIVTSNDFEAQVYSGVSRALNDNDLNVDLVVDGRNMNDSRIVSDIILPEFRKLKKRGVSV